MTTSILVSNIIRSPGAPVFGSYRVRGVTFMRERAELHLRLCDTSGSIQARIGAFCTPYDHPGELENAVLFATGVVITSGSELTVQLVSLEETSFGVHGTIDTLPREVVPRCALPYFDMIVSRLRSIESQCIRRFAELTLGHPRVFENFFVVGASHSVHHPEAGGLARHVCEMIRELDSSKLMSRLPVWRRDLAAACILAHDLPKAIGSTRYSGGYDPEKSYDELIQSLRVPLAFLDAEWPAGADHVRNVFRGFPRAGSPQTVEAISIWSFDRLSAAADAEKTAFDTRAAEHATEVITPTGRNSQRVFQRPCPPPDVDSD